AAADDSPTSHRVHGLGVDGGVDDGDAFEFVGVVSDGLHHLAVVASQEAWLDEQTTLETTVREVADELLRSRRSCGGVACTSDDADAGLEHVGVPVDFRAGIKQRHFENTPSITKEPRATTARPAGIARNSR